MDLGAIIIIIIIGGIIVLTFYIIGLYNNLLDSRNKVEEKFSKIDYELQKELELIPNLIEILKKHTKHEDKIINEIEKYNKIAYQTKCINDKICLLNNLDKILNKIYKLTETYSELKSSRKFNSIKKELNDIENKINYAKSFYNSAVSNYNNLRNTNHSNIVAKLFKFEEINNL